MEAVRAAIASGLPEWMRDAGTEGLVYGCTMAL